MRLTSVGDLFSDAGLVGDVDDEVRVGHARTKVRRWDRGLVGHNAASARGGKGGGAQQGSRCYSRIPDCRRSAARIQGSGTGWCRIECTAAVPSGVRSGERAGGESRRAIDDAHRNGRYLKCEVALYGNHGERAADPPEGGGHQHLADVSFLVGAM